MEQALAPEFSDFGPTYLPYLRWEIYIYANLGPQTRKRLSILYVDSVHFATTITQVENIVKYPSQQVPTSA